MNFSYFSLTEEKVKELLDIIDAKTYFFKIPNYEVKLFFKNTFVKDYSHSKTAIYFKMLEDLRKGN